MTEGIKQFDNLKATIIAVNTDLQLIHARRFRDFLIFAVHLYKIFDPLDVKQKYYH